MHAFLPENIECEIMGLALGAVRMLCITFMHIYQGGIRHEVHCGDLGGMR